MYLRCSNVVLHDVTISTSDIGASRHSLCVSTVTVAIGALAGVKLIVKLIGRLSAAFIMEQKQYSSPLSANLVFAHNRAER